MKEGREPLIKESLTLKNQSENNAENGGNTTGGRENWRHGRHYRPKSVGPLWVEYFNSNFGNIHFPNELISHMY